MWNCGTVILRILSVHILLENSTYVLSFGKHLKATDKVSVFFCDECEIADDRSLKMKYLDATMYNQNRAI